MITPISKDLYLKYKLQSDILDTLALSHKPIPEVDFLEVLDHFQILDKKRNDIKVMFDQSTFLQRIGLCIITDKSGKIIETEEDFQEIVWRRQERICISLTVKGIEAVQNRTYESLYMTTYLNYRMLKLSIISISIAITSILIAVFFQFGI